MIDVNNRLHSRDIKLNNWIIVDGEEIELDFRMMGKLFKQSNAHLINSMQGIPLTGNWLEQWGFKREYKQVSEKEGYIFYIHDDLTAFFKILSFPGPNFPETGSRYRLCFASGNEVYSPNLSSTFQFVHQLQNLHFAITGKEISDYKSLEDRARDWLKAD